MVGCPVYRSIFYTRDIDIAKYYLFLILSFIIPWVINFSVNIILVVLDVKQFNAHILRAPHWGIQIVAVGPTQRTMNPLLTTLLQQLREQVNNPRVVVSL